MEMEAMNTRIIGKKILSIIQVFYYMIRKGISNKTKLIHDLQLLLKRGNKVASKAFTNIFMTFHHEFSCKSNNINLSFISPNTSNNNYNKEYEFSCSNSPATFHNAAAPLIFHNKNLINHRNRRRGVFSNKQQYCLEDNVATVTAVQKVLEMLNNNENYNNNYMVEASPLVGLPGFGRSPSVRQLRITDSPFPIKENDEQEVSKVNKAAEEFIKRFYTDLRLQKSSASPYNYHMNATNMWG